LIGLLVAGGIIRTADKTGNVAEARGLGEGRGNGWSDGNDRGEGVQALDGSGYGQGRGQGQGESGSGRGQGQAANGAERLYPNYENPPENWATYEGTVVVSPADGDDLIIATDDGQEIVVGTGPGYMEAQGFVLQAGEAVQVQGYWEDDELKAAQVMRQSDGQAITLRDQTGRPAWAGNGRRASGQNEAGASATLGQGAGTGLAEVEEWLSVQGTVVSVDNLALVVQTADGSQITVEGRPWWFAQEQGFAAEAGDEVTLVGFDEDGEFEVGQLANDTAGTAVQIREDSGRPLWAGGGRRGQ
jgi:hypothetical protein